MHKLFVLSHLRTLQRLGVTEYSPANFEEIKTRNTLAPSSEALLYRLPREELKHIMNTQCPINRYLSHNPVLNKPTLRLLSNLPKHCVIIPKLKRAASAPSVPLPRSVNMQANLGKAKNTKTPYWIFWTISMDCIRSSSQRIFTIGNGFPHIDLETASSLQSMTSLKEAKRSKNTMRLDWMERSIFKRGWRGRKRVRRMKKIRISSFIVLWASSKPSRVRSEKLRSLKKSQNRK